MDLEKHIKCVEAEIRIIKDNLKDPDVENRAFLETKLVAAEAELKRLRALKPG